MKLISNTVVQGFRGGTVDETLAIHAGDKGSIPGAGRSHVPWGNQACIPQLLSLCPIAGEPQLLSPRVGSTEAHRP